LDSSHSDPSPAIGAGITVTKPAFLDTVSTAPVVRLADSAPWWAQTADDHAIQVAAEDDFEPIAV
jgi:hypothetical protein